jgi:hypothetical protein
MKSLKWCFHGWRHFSMAIDLGHRDQQGLSLTADSEIIWASSRSFAEQYGNHWLVIKGKTIRCIRHFLIIGVQNRHAKIKQQINIHVLTFKENTFTTM